MIGGPKAYYDEGLWLHFYITYLHTSACTTQQSISVSKRYLCWFVDADVAVVSNILRRIRPSEAVIFPSLLTAEPSDIVGYCLCFFLLSCTAFCACVAPWSRQSDLSQ